jgi:hypothetical protein
MRINQGRPPRERIGRKDVISFEEATQKRTQPRDRQQIINQLTIRNYVRMTRMKGDIKWMKRTLKRMGLNPEEWSTYL